MLASSSTCTAQRWFIAALLLFFVALSVRYSVKITSAARDNRSAFLRWREQIQDLEQGVNIYHAHNYPNPPIMALLLHPLTELPPLAGSLLWFYLKVGMALVVLFWAFHLLETPTRPFPLVGKMLATLLSLRALTGDLTHGNVNIFILFLVMAALVAYVHQRDLTSGLLLALAIACKVTPALFVPYFAWKRQWRVLAGCLLGLALFLVVVPGSILGHAENAALLRTWVERMVLPYVVAGDVTTEHQNQSLPGVLHRLLTESASFSQYTPAGYVPIACHNFADLPPSVVSVLLKLCTLAFALVVVWSCRTPTTARRDWRLIGELSLVLVGMLIFCERTWKHHCVMLVLPFAFLTNVLVTHWHEPILRRRVLLALSTVFALMTATSTGIFGATTRSTATPVELVLPATWELGTLLDRGGKLAQVYGAYLWAFLTLAVAIVYLLRQTRRTRHDATYAVQCYRVAVVETAAELTSRQATVSAS